MPAPSRGDDEPHGSDAAATDNAATPSQATAALITPAAAVAAAYDPTSTGICEGVVEEGDAPPLQPSAAGVDIATGSDGTAASVAANDSAGYTAAAVAHAEAVAQAAKSASDAREKQAQTVTGGIDAPPQPGITPGKLDVSPSWIELLKDPALRHGWLVDVYRTRVDDDCRCCDGEV